jgi:hypothetical protein
MCSTPSGRHSTKFSCFNCVQPTTHGVLILIIVFINGSSSSSCSTLSTAHQRRPRSTTTTTPLILNFFIIRHHVIVVNLSSSWPEGRGFNSWGHVLFYLSGGFRVCPGSHVSLSFVGTKTAVNAKLRTINFCFCFFGRHGGLCPPPPTQYTAKKLVHLIVTDGTFIAGERRCSELPDLQAPNAGLFGQINKYRV